MKKLPPCDHDECPPTKCLILDQNACPNDTTNKRNKMREELRAEALKALKCLFIAVDESIAIDVQKKCVDYFYQLECELQQLKHYLENERALRKQVELHRDKAGEELEMERDGKWIDKWGACKLCSGEIPYGHTESCDLYKNEKEINLLKTKLSVLEKSIRHD